VAEAIAERRFLMSIMNLAVSGMLANSNWLTTISQNVSNANTAGYKDVETEFSDLVDQSDGSQSQVAGVTTSMRALNALQGQDEATTTATDLSVQGAGFFVVSNASGDIFFTRNGSFVPDASGNLVNSAGYYLMGASLQGGAPSGAITSLAGLTTVNVAAAGEAASPSTAATLTANLPSAASAIAAANLPSTNTAGAAYSAETSVVAYDNLGGAHTINLYFANTGGNTWEVDAYDASTAAGGGGFPYSSGPLATQTLTFDPTNGALASGSPLAIPVPGGRSLSVNLSPTTQLASSFAVNSSTINGSAPGSLTGISISQNGTLSFQTGNGSSTAAYEIPLVNVPSPDNLTSVVGEAYQANYQSGPAQVGVAGTGGLGAINASSLESSTVDLATELTNMIQAQSSYEANSKVFQTGAKLLDVLNQLQP
jgi:flagellar hook protein FlgE